MENEEIFDCSTYKINPPKIRLHKYSSHNEQVILKALAKALWFVKKPCLITDSFVEQSLDGYHAYICLSNRKSHIWSMFIPAFLLFENENPIQNFDDVLEMSIHVIGCLTHTREERKRLLELFRIVLIGGDYIIRMDD